jgi:hypothetical protein
VQDVVERSREKSSMLQGFGDAVLRAEALEDQPLKSRKHATAMQSKLDTAFAKYHNDIQDMQAKSDDLVRKNKTLRNKNKGTPLVLLSTCWRPRGSLTRFSLLFAELEARVDQLKASETDLKNIFYQEQPARYSSLIIRSLPSSATSTWSFVLLPIVTSSTATNHCRS